MAIKDACGIDNWHVECCTFAREQYTYGAVPIQYADSMFDSVLILLGFGIK